MSKDGPKKPRKQASTQLPEPKAKARPTLLRSEALGSKALTQLVQDAKTTNMFDLLLKDISQLDNEIFKIKNVSSPNSYIFQFINLPQLADIPEIKWLAEYTGPTLLKLNALCGIYEKHREKLSLEHPPAQMNQFEVLGLINDINAVFKQISQVILDIHNQLNAVSWERFYGREDIKERVNEQFEQLTKSLGIKGVKLSNFSNELYMQPLTRLKMAGDSANHRAAKLESQDLTKDEMILHSAIGLLIDNYQKSIGSEQAKMHNDLHDKHEILEKCFSGKLIDLAKDGLPPNWDMKNSDQNKLFCNNVIKLVDKVIAGLSDEQIPVPPALSKEFMEIKKRFDDRVAEDDPNKLYRTNAKEFTTYLENFNKYFKISTNRFSRLFFPQHENVIRADLFYFAFNKIATHLYYKMDNNQRAQIKRIWLTDEEIATLRTPNDELVQQQRKIIDAKSSEIIALLKDLCPEAQTPNLSDSEKVLKISVGNIFIREATPEHTKVAKEALGMSKRPELRV